MAKTKTARKKKDPFDLPFLAEYYFTKETAIKKAKFILSDGGSVEIGIFRNTVLDCTSGAFLLRDKGGKVVSGTVCETKDATGLEWYQSLHREFMLRSNCN